MTYGWDNSGFRQTTVKTNAGHYACHCVGPQPGFPKCPCMMRGLIQRDGRWVQPEKDLGPVYDSKERD